jgi:F420 biosynthesis protein FbiB-like protein
MRDDLQEFLRSRRSVRHFKPQALDTELVNRLLETASYAPSAHNRQPWRFAVLTRPETKSRFGEALAAEFRRDLAADGLPEPEIEATIQRSKNRIDQAPVIVVLCMDTSEMDVYPDEKRSQAERMMAAQSTALAGLQLQLAAHAEGLCSVWVCAPLFAPQVACESLGLPHSWEPQAMIFLGYGDSLPKPKAVKNLHEIAMFV